MDVSVPINYVIAYIWCIIATYSVAIMNCIVDSLVTTFSHCFSAHFKYIGKLFQNIHGDENNIFNLISENVQYHNSVLELFSEFQAITGLIVFFEYGISSLQVCVAAYQITLHISDPKIIFLISFTSAIFLQVCMYSYNGNLLEDYVRL